MKIAISGNTYQHDMLVHIERLLLALAARGVQLVAERGFDRYLRQQLPGLPPMQQCELQNGVDAQVIMSIGGDGTFLRTAQAVCSQDIPIMGINSGHLGYLTTADVKDTAVIVEALTAGSYRIEHRSMLELHCDSAQASLALPYALNEIAIVRQETSSMIDVTVAIDGQPLTNFKGDGLLVCTPTGSTAYNLSVGGPIMEPTTRCFALSPISPHALTMRPIVVRDDAVLDITTRSRAPLYQVSLDGQCTVLESGTSVRIARASHTTGVIQLQGTNFAHTLRNKLMWGKDNR